MSAEPSAFQSSPFADLAPIRIAIGSRFDHIEIVQVVVDDTLDRFGFDDDARHWISIALREAVANAIKHGNREDPAKWVEVELGVDGTDVVIHIRDQGSGFDPDQVDDPLAPENLLRPNGRGIFYMKNFMDDIIYSFGPDGGTQLTLRKRLPQHAADASA